MRRCFVGFLPRTLGKEVCASFFEKALQGAEWIQPAGPNGPIPRKTAWMVFFECDCAYRYGRIEVKPQQYPQWMCALMHWVMPCCGINEQKDWPNSCNLNLYESGGMSVGWHADDEQLFQGKQRDCRIISLSLGATRAFEVRSNWSELDSTVRLELGDGDLCTMEGLVQKHFQHRVPREDKVTGPRINLTWRWIAICLKMRETARARAEMEVDCPLFLSQRMRRMLASILNVPMSEPAGEKEFDSSAVEESVAKVIAALTFNHNLPPSYVQYFLNQEPQLWKAQQDSDHEHVYRSVLERVQRGLREDPLPNVDLNPSPEDSLRNLQTAVVSLKASTNAAYGTTSANNEDVVRQRRGEYSNMKAWFGPDIIDEDPYVFNRVMTNKLPIAQHKTEITELIRDNQIVLIQGETGCGKTTQVPQYILEAALRMQAEAKHGKGTDNRRPVRIVVTQPRRIAAITVAKRVAEELGEKVGEGVVGYKIRGTTVASPKCKLLFCTTGVVLRRLANEGSKFMFGPKTVTHLLVDEVHERGVETDFMLTFLREIRVNRPNLRVVLMSATMDTECFLKYFSLPVKVANGHANKITLKQPPMVVCPAFCHPVAECYMESINARLGRNRSPEAKSPEELRREPTEMSESDGIDYDLILKIVEEIETSPDGAWTFAPESMRATAKDPHRGAVLVFLPGLGEITQLMSKLTDDSTMSSKWWVLPLHANLPPEEQQLCFSTSLPAGCTRKIICSTNVAETSVTVPDVTVVIDTCRERRNQVDRHSNTPMLREQWCALDSLKQRRGRAGRVQPGVCLRLLPERNLERLDAVSPPEMQRVPLENVYLQVCASGIDDRPGFLAKTPDPPDELSVAFAEAALKDLGALDQAQPDGLTPLGRHLAALPCHPRLGKILVLGCLLGEPSPCLSICAAMSVRNPMMTTQDTSKRASWQSARMEMVAEIGTRSDHCAWAHIVQEWRFGDMKQRELCKKLGLSFERMASSMFERRHLLESLVQVGLLPGNFKDLEWERKNKVPDWNLVRAAVVGGLYPNIIHVSRSPPKFQSATMMDKAKYLTYQVLQRHVKMEQQSYPKRLNVHPNSLMFGHDQFHCPWLAYYTIQQTSKLYAYDVSEVSPFALLLFGGDLEPNHGGIEVGKWATFKCRGGKQLLPLLQAARKAIQDVLERKLEDLKFDLSSSKELRACIELLKCNGLGFRKEDPADIVRCSDGQDREFNEFENETAYMTRKDNEQQERMNKVWADAKKLADSYFFSVFFEFQLPAHGPRPPCWSQRRGPTMPRLLRWAPFALLSLGVSGEGAGSISPHHGQASHSRSTPQAKVHHQERQTISKAADHQTVLLERSDPKPESKANSSTGSPKEPTCQPDSELFQQVVASKDRHLFFSQRKATTVPFQDISGIPRSCESWKDKPQCCTRMFYKRLADEIQPMAKELAYVQDQYSHFREDVVQFALEAQTDKQSPEAERLSEAADIAQQGIEHVLDFINECENPLRLFFASMACSLCRPNLGDYLTEGTILQISGENVTEIAKNCSMMPKKMKQAGKLFMEARNVLRENNTCQERWYVHTQTWLDRAARLSLLRSKEIRPKYVESTFLKALQSKGYVYEPEEWGDVLLLHISVLATDDERRTFVGQDEMRFFVPKESRIQDMREKAKTLDDPDFSDHVDDEGASNTDVDDDDSDNVTAANNGANSLSELGETSEMSEDQELKCVNGRKRRWHCQCHHCWTGYSCNVKMVEGPGINQDHHVLLREVRPDDGWLSPEAQTKLK
ncbi:unnamed protein product [Symbiodinium microadriaticum]|nr:unnamed protein product [Symbiodinium microadriaticum]